MSYMIIPVYSFTCDMDDCVNEEEIVGGPLRRAIGELCRMPDPWAVQKIDTGQWIERFFICPRHPYHPAQVQARARMARVREAAQ